MNTKNDRMSLLLGAANGIFSFVVLAAIERVTIYFANIQDQIDMQAGPVGYILKRQPFWNLSTLLFHIGLFVLASFLLHRSFSRRIDSVFLLWVAVGAGIVLAWTLTLLLIAAVAYPLEKILETLIKASSQWLAFRFVVTIMAVNAIYGTVVQWATKTRWRRLRYS